MDFEVCLVQVSHFSEDTCGPTVRDGHKFRTQSNSQSKLFPSNYPLNLSLLLQGKLNSSPVIHLGSLFGAAGACPPLWSQLPAPSCLARGGHFKFLSPEKCGLDNC